MNKRKCWKRLASGQYIDLNNLQTEDVKLRDIEVSLNHIIRFTGHHKDKVPLSVAQHSLLCLNLACAYEPKDTELHKAVFSHDFAEAYIGDVAAPVKWAMGDKWYDFALPIENTVERAVLGYNLDQDMHDRVKMYDLISLDIERRSIWSSQYGKDKWPDCPVNIGSLSEKDEWFESVVDTYVPIENIWRDLNDV